MDSFMKEFKNLKIQWEDVTSATNNFDDKNVVGCGAFGSVYTGALPRIKDRNMVAFKRLDPKYGQGDPEFLKEITYLSRYKHANLIPLLGYCIQEKEKIIVYEYASRGSLDRHLNSADLTCRRRLKICLDTAKGLHYLHTPRDTSQILIHCDVKSANILLDDEWNAKVADFGLSKIAPVNLFNSVLLTSPLGTLGYCDPVFWETCVLTKESDVYSLGVVLLEVLCGKLCFQKTGDGELLFLVLTWKKSYEENKLHEIIFTDIRQNLCPTSLEIFSEIAFQCLKRSRLERPNMSLVVEKLERALKCQEFFELPPEVVKKYEEIAELATPPLTYSSLKELKALLSNGFFINNGKTWISMNDDEQRIMLTSCQQFIYEDFMGECRYSDEYNSRFEVGTYNTRSEEFALLVSTEFLSPYITYTVNLVFKCPQIFKEKSKQQYISLIYKINRGEHWEHQISVVHVGEKREDEWLVARLHDFTANDQSSLVEVDINFRRLEYSLQLEGIEFQPLPLEMNNVDDDDELDEKKYEAIIKSAEPTLFYSSLHQLRLLFSKGVHLNGGKTWFHLNDSRQHCELLSIKKALIQDEGQKYVYDHEYNSRFLVGALLLLPYCKDFKVRARAQFLTPLITYTVNLVFKFADETNLMQNQLNIGFVYKVQGLTKNSYAYIIDKREDGWWMVELCHFTSEQGTTTTADLEITFRNCWTYTVVEGIEFLPVQELEKAEQHLEETQPISSDSDLDTYPEQKLPTDYEDIIKMAKDSVPMNTTKKELCLILSNGFLLKNGQEWLSLDKNAKKCLMLSPIAAIDFRGNMRWQSSPGSRFGETLDVTYCNKFKIVGEIKSQVLESETTYATYLVYKLPESDQSKLEGPLALRDAKDLDYNYWYVFLVSPETPVISASGKVDQNTHNPLNRPDLKGIPKERRDGWMEVKVWEFQTPTPTTAEIIPISLKFYSTDLLKGLIIQGIEFRPIL